MAAEDGFSLAKTRVAIIGLGLMGGSMALALKGKCADLLGVAPRQATRELALREGIVSRASAEPAEILPDADLAVLATPIPVIFDTLEQMPRYTERPCIVIDLGSTKRAITEAMERLPERFDALGGHPICGKEKLSLENADAALYHNAPFVLTPLQRTSPRASAAGLQLAEAVGARPVWMDAAAHDRILARTSHLPFLLSSALVGVVPEEAAPLIGPGFRSTSRLASTPSSMMMGILQTNKENLLESIRLFRENLESMEKALQAEDSSGLQQILDAARARHQKYQP